MSDIPCGYKRPEGLPEPPLPECFTDRGPDLRAQRREEALQALHEYIMSVLHRLKIPEGALRREELATLPALLEVYLNATSRRNDWRY